MDIIDEVRQIVAKSLRLPVEQLTPATRLEDVAASSLDVIEIVYELEEKFGVAISVKSEDNKFVVEAEKDGAKTGELAFATIGDIAAAMQRLVQSKTA